MELKELIEQKRSIELEIKETEEKLKFYEGMKYDEPLIDNDGYPRADLDFESLRDYRLLKKKINMLINDFNDVYNDISKLLISNKNNNLVNKSSSLIVNNNNNNSSNNNNTVISDKPFCIITEVLENSPAYNSGLFVDYKVIKFGTITNDINLIPKYCMDNINKQIDIIILDNNGIIRNIELVPKNWEGPGILGCRFLNL